MIGTKIYKDDMSNYTDCAIWCNANNATIEDKGDYYEVVTVPVYIPTEDEIQESLTIAVQNYMDTTVQARNYDNINSACTYANSTDHIFAAEGVACVKWRDAVWRKCYDILGEVKAGTSAIPTAEEVIAKLPKLEW